MMGGLYGHPPVIASSSGQIAIEGGSTCSGSESMALDKLNALPASQTRIGPPGGFHCGWEDAACDSG